MLHSFKNIFPSKEIESELWERYLLAAKQTKNVGDLRYLLKLVEEYKNREVVFEPIRDKLTLEEQKDLHNHVFYSVLYGRKKRYKAAIGLMMVLDGAFPKVSTLSLLKIIFGKEFIDAIKISKDNLKIDKKTYNKHFQSVKKLIELVRRN